MAPGTVQEELARIIRQQKLAGCNAVQMSRQNIDCLGQKPGRNRLASIPPAPKAETVPTSVVKTVPQAPHDCAAVGVAPVGNWNELADAVGSCRKCPLCQNRRQPLLDDGCRQAKVMFIGDWPMKEDDETGRLFSSEAGQMLTKIIQAMGLDRNAADPEKSVYLANVLKCKTPDNRLVNNTEAKTCLPFLIQQIKLANPKVIVILGGVALRLLLGLQGISKIRGTWQNYCGIPVMPTLHPNFILKAKSEPDNYNLYRRQTWNDIQQVMAMLNK